MSNGLQLFGDVAGGIGASIRGNLPQFQAQRDAKAERKLKKTALASDRARASADGRKATLLADAVPMFKAAEKGDWNRVAALGKFRLKEGQNFPGVDFTETQDMVTMAEAAAQGNTQAAEALLGQLNRGANLAFDTGLVTRPETLDKSAGQREFESLIKDFSPEDQAKARRQKANLDARPSSREDIDAAAERARRIAEERSGVKIKTERSLNAILADRKKGIDIAGAEADRLSGFISEGIAAFDALPKIKRGLELLKNIKTGGLTAKAKSVSDFFGTTSGDIGELNNILGQRVLDGLAAFTGAISEGERAFVERMETSLKSGTQVNVRLLEQGQRMLERKIGRARKAAEITQDDFSLDLFDNPQGLTLAQPAQPAQPQAGQQRNVVVDF